MNDRCGYCGDPYEQDTCTGCGRMRNDPPRQFVVYGPGFMGDYDTIEQAAGLLNAHPNLGPAALYIRVDADLGDDPVGIDEQQLVGRLMHERDAAIGRSITAKFAVACLRDALMAYMEPAGDDITAIRRRAKSALRVAEKALPYSPPLETSPSPHEPARTGGETQ